MSDFYALKLMAEAGLFVAYEKLSCLRGIRKQRKKLERCWEALGNKLNLVINLCYIK